MKIHQIKPKEPARDAINNDYLYCAIEASLALKIKMSSVADSIFDEAESLEQAAPPEIKDYLNRLTTGHIFAVLNVVNTTCALQFASGDLAVIATGISIRRRHFAEGRVVLTTRRRMAETIFDSGVYDAATQVMFMVAHAWSGQRHSRLRYTSDYEHDFRDPEGPATYMQSVLSDLNIECPTREFDRRYDSAMDLLIMSNHHNWNSNYAWPQNWADNTPALQPISV